MTRLNTMDMMLVDDLFGYRSGYVLDFSNYTFQRFLADELGVEIYSDAFSHDGGSKGKRLGCYLRSAKPQDAARALKALWDYREALHARTEESEKVKDARSRFFDLVRKLEGGSPAQTASAQKPRLDKTLLERLNSELLRVSMLAPQPRGYAFEAFLKDLFDAYGMVARGSFRLVGEQIDGSFSLADQRISWKPVGRMRKPMRAICLPSTENVKTKPTGRAAFSSAKAVSQPMDWSLLAGANDSYVWTALIWPTR